MTRTALWICIAAAALAACRTRDPLYCPMHLDDPACVDGGTDIPPGYVTIGGKVNGLTGAGLVILNNGGDDKLIASDGDFRFPMPIPMGTNYEVTVGTQPTNPSQSCMVTNGTGTADTDVSSVQIDCTTATYAVGGTVVGCGGGCANVLTLVNGQDELLIPGNGTFHFPTKVASQSVYNVTVKNNNPSSCSVSGGMGIVGNADITTVVVNCTAGTYILGGMPPNGGVQGLNGTVGLHAAYTMPNASDTISVSTNSFAFPTPLATNRGYTVTVSTQPSYPPASQTCSVTMGTGTIMGSNITSVGVNCQTNKFTVGGSVSGLNGGTLVLLNNGGDSKTITANGAFTFATPIFSGLTYMATVSSNPFGQVCTITKGSGTITNGNVTSIAVACGDAGVKCGTKFCNSSQQCCDPEGNAQCIGKTQSCYTIALPCDDAADCGGGMKCCAMTHNGNGALESVSCSATCGGSNPVQLCDPTTNECASGTCSAWGTLPGYNACL